MKLSAIRAALAELQLTPSKTLGQNFLHDQNLARWIVAQLDAQPGDELVEIGPGLGALTGAALETGARLTVLEKDRRLADFLSARFAGEERLRVVPGDALDFDVRALWGRGAVKIFGNLPYYVSTPLLFHFTSPACPTQRAVFLLQRELAERLAATTGRGRRIMGWSACHPRAAVAGGASANAPGERFPARAESGLRFDLPDPARPRRVARLRCADF